MTTKTSEKFSLTGALRRSRREALMVAGAMSIALVPVLGCTAETTSTEPAPTESPAHSGFNVERKTIDGQKVLVAYDGVGSPISSLTITTDGTSEKITLTKFEQAGQSTMVRNVDSKGHVDVEISTPSGTEAYSFLSSEAPPAAMARSAAQFDGVWSQWLVAMKDKANGAHYNNPSAPAGNTIHTDNVCTIVCALVGTTVCSILTVGLGSFVCGVVFIIACETVCMPDPPPPGCNSPTGPYPVGCE